MIIFCLLPDIVEHMSRSANAKTRGREQPGDLLSAAAYTNQTCRSCPHRLHRTAGRPNGRGKSESQHLGRDALWTRRRQLAAHLGFQSQSRCCKRTKPWLMREQSSVAATGHLSASSKHSQLGPRLCEASRTASPKGHDMYTLRASCCCTRIVLVRIPECK